MKKLAVIAAGLVMLFLAGCVYYVPGSYSYRTAYTATYTPAVDDGYGCFADGADFIVLKVYSNRYIFYGDYNDVVAVWIFQPDGTVIKRGRIINGIVRIYYAPGVPACEMVYKDNRRDGCYRLYYRNGRIRESGFYTGGIRSGMWKYYGEEGNMWRNYEFVKGKKRVIVEGKEPARPQNDWDWNIITREDNGKKVKEQPFNKKDIYPKDNGKKWGEDPEDRNNGWGDDKKGGKPQDKKWTDDAGKPDNRGNAWGRDNGTTAPGNSENSDRGNKGNAWGRDNDTTAPGNSENSDRGNKGNAWGRDNDTTAPGNSENSDRGNKGNAWGRDNDTTAPGNSEDTDKGNAWGRDNDTTAPGNSENSDSGGKGNAWGHDNDTTAPGNSENAGKGSNKDNVQAPAATPVKVIKKPVATPTPEEEAVKDGDKDTVKDTDKDNGKDIDKDTGKDAVSDGEKDSGKNVDKDTGKDNAKEVDGSGPKADKTPKPSGRDKLKTR